MDNVITVTLKEDQQKRIEFESNPTLFELIAVKLIVDEVLEHNFNKSDILYALPEVYNRLENVEEVRRDDVKKD